MSVSQRMGAPGRLTLSPALLVLHQSEDGLVQREMGGIEPRTVASQLTIASHTKEVIGQGQAMPFSDL